MIERQAFYVVTCDNCGERMSYDEDYGFVVLETLQEVFQALRDQEWEVGVGTRRSWRARLYAAFRMDIVGTDRLNQGKLTCSACIEDREIHERASA